MRKKNIFVYLIIAVIFVGALYFGLRKKTDEFLVRNDLDSLTLEEMVAKHEDLIGEKGFIASVLGDRITFKDSQEEYDIMLPEDKYYLSVAPYIQNTHPCFNHNLATCQGELTNSKVRVTVKRGSEIIYDEFVETYSNGFFGLWLPKDESLSIFVEKDGMSSIAQVETTTESPTCLTTMRLQ